MKNQYDNGKIKSAFTKEYLLQEYVEKRRFIKDIALEHGCSGVTVRNYLIKHGIPTETRYSDRPRFTGLNPARLVLTEEYLRREYTEKGRSINSISRELDCSNSIISEYLQKYGISKEKRFSDSRRELNGKDFYGFKMDNGYLRVLMPGHPQADERGYARLHVILAEYFFQRRIKENEVVHHVNEDKMDNRKENLVIMTKLEHDRYHTQKRWDEGTFIRG